MAIHVNIIQLKVYLFIYFKITFLIYSKCAKRIYLILNFMYLWGFEDFDEIEC